MARRVDYYFRETATGLRRNGILAWAAMSTAYIALFLFGLALLISREFNLVTDALTGNVEVAVYLTDPVNPDTVGRLTSQLQHLDAVGQVTYEDKAAACARAKELFANQPAFNENVDCSVYPASLRVKLKDTSRFDEIQAAMGCAPDATKGGALTCSAPGVRSVSDYSALLQRLTTITRVLSFGILAIALIMLGSAIALVANTLRMGMFARRKEIGIMRLVGATNWRIRVPFLIEGLAEALLGATAAIVSLFLIKVFAIDRLRGQIAWLPFVRNSDLMAIAPWILIAAALIAIVAGTIGMRRFLDV
jgi:cell division transport system permease protein